MKKICLTTALIVSLSSAFAQKKEFGWLEGTWKLKDKNAYEIWTGSADKPSLRGKAFRVKGADTTVTEMIRLEMYEQAFHYIPDVAGPQGDVYFKVTSFDDHGFVAENPKHDFPKLIRYKHIIKDGKEMIEAAIEGNGKTIPFIYEKVK